MTTAQTIINQLGGNRLVAMTGARQFVNTGSGVNFRVGRGARNSINLISISLNGFDLYDVQFLRTRGVAMTTVGEFENVFAGNLRSLFTSETGFALTI